MNTKGRLNAAFKAARQISFDDNSKLVFVSDVHRGDDSHSDEFGKNRHIYNYALDYYYMNDFTYIEVGDGDELLEHPNYEHILSAHRSTFDILKKFYDANRLYMLFGNHNVQLKNPHYVKKNLYHVYDDQLDEVTDLFPYIEVYEALVLRHSQTNQEIFVVHGNQGDLLNDQLWWISCLFIRFFWRFLHLLGVNYAASPAKNKFKRHKLEKNYIKWSSSNDNKIIICGHTHRPRFPKPNEVPYFNSGCCMHPRGITCMELENGHISMVTFKVQNKKDGSLYIERTVIKGPAPIVEFKK